MNTHIIVFVRKYYGDIAMQVIEMTTLIMEQNEDKLKQQYYYKYMNI